jgi:hypothetical protein
MPGNTCQTSPNSSLILECCNHGIFSNQKKCVEMIHICTPISRKVQYVCNSKLPCSNTFCLVCINSNHLWRQQKVSLSSLLYEIQKIQTIFGNSRKYRFPCCCMTLTKARKQAAIRQTISSFPSLTALPRPAFPQPFVFCNRPKVQRHLRTYHLMFQSSKPRAYSIAQTCTIRARCLRSTHCSRKHASSCSTSATVMYERNERRCHKSKSCFTHLIKKPCVRLRFKLFGWYVRFVLACKTLHSKCRHWVTQCRILMNLGAPRP